MGACWSNLISWPVKPARKFSSLLKNYAKSKGQAVARGLIKSSFQRWLFCSTRVLSCTILCSLFPRGDYCGLCSLFLRSLQRWLLCSTTLVSGTWSEKKIITVDFFWSWHVVMCRLWIQKIKIGRWGGFELGPFFSLFLMRKRRSSGQKWVLRPYFPLIRGMFVFRSRRFSFRSGTGSARTESEEKATFTYSLFLNLGLGTSSAWN